MSKRNRPNAATVLRRAVELISQRPGPTIGTAVVTQIPTSLLTVGLVAMFVPFLREFAPSNGTPPDETMDRILATLSARVPEIVGATAVYLALMFGLYAVQVGAVMRVVVDAYERTESSFGAAILSGLRRAPSLAVYLFLKQLVTLVAGVATAAIFIVPASSLASDASFRGPLIGFSILLGMGLGVVIAFVTWSMMSLGTGAIVAERVGPFRALVRGVALARSETSTVVQTWIIVGLGYVVLSCIINCAGSMFSAPVRFASDGIAALVASQVIEFVPIAVLSALSHSVGAVLYAEVARVDAKPDPVDYADIFR